METQKIQNSQNHLDKEQQSWRNNFKWNLIYKHFELLCYTPEAYNKSTMPQ